MCRVIGKKASGLTPAQESMCDLWLTERARALDISKVIVRLEGVYPTRGAMFFPEGLVIELSTGHVVTPERGQFVPYLDPTYAVRRREEPYKFTRADYQAWVEDAVNAGRRL